MKLPDLQRIVGYLQDKFRLRDWKIEARYDADPRDPSTGAPVYGYMHRMPEIPCASLVIRPPASGSTADMIEFLDTCVHEVGHCRLAHLVAQGGVIAEENATHAIAGFITELLSQTPAYNSLLMKAWSKDRSMDEEKSAALAALALKAGELMASGAVPEELRSILEQLIALAAGGSAEVPAAEVPAEGEAVPPVDGEVKEQPLGLQKQDDDPKTKAAAKVKAETAALLAKLKIALGGGAESETALKSLEEKMAADRSAAVDGLLDTRADLTPKQRARLREIGLAHGVAKVREDLAELVPAPKGEPKAEVRAKLGEDKPIRGSNTVAKAMPSGDKKADQLFRIIGKDPTKDGVEIPSNDSGILVRFSIVEAFAKIKHNAEQAREAQRAKMGGTR